jgi:hypothetical protein
MLEKDLLEKSHPQERRCCYASIFQKRTGAQRKMSLEIAKCIPIFQIHSGILNYLYGREEAGAILSVFFSRNDGFSLFLPEHMKDAFIL